MNPPLSAMKHEKSGDNNRILWLVILWFYFFEYIRPQEQYLSVLKYFKIPSLLMLLSFFYFIRGDKDWRQILFKDTTVKLSAFFLMLMVLSISYAIHVSSFWWTFYLGLAMMCIMLPTISVLSDVSRLKIFFKFWIFIHAWLAIIVISNGGRGSGSFSLDENEAAVVLAMSLPFLFFYSQLDGLKLSHKLLLMVMAVVTLVAIVITGSRGGFIGLVVCLLMIWWYSAARFKLMVYGVLLVVVAGGMLLAILPENYVNEITSLGDSAEDGTGHHRLYSWSVAWEMFKGNPVLGVGVGGFPWQVTEYAHLSSMYDPDFRSFQGRQAHSILFTLLPELGVVGTILYVMIFVSCYKRLRRVMVINADADADDKLMAAMAKALVASFFCFFRGQPLHHKRNQIDDAYRQIR